MGTSGLVGQFATIDVMGVDAIWKVLLLHILLPAVLTLIISEFMRKKNWIKAGDMSLHVE